MSPFWVMFLILWFFAGICGLIMMWFCDTATGRRFYKDEFYFVGSWFSSIAAALLFPFIALPIGILALCEWKKYTQELEKQNEAMLGTYSVH